MLTPEQQARTIIDSQLVQAGWAVVDRNTYIPGQACAMREALMTGNKEADYLLFLDNKAIGVIEAKRAETDISSAPVILQAEGYTRRIPEWCHPISTPLPLVYVANGKAIYWRDMRGENGQYESISNFPKPQKLARYLGIDGEFAGLPALQQAGLRACQFQAVTSLEASFRDGNRRALMVLATGAGKTFTACLAAYRMLQYTPAKRVLFLVDRNNLGKQAESEFVNFNLTENKESLGHIFSVKRLSPKQQTIEKTDQIVITTIHRLYALLTGQSITDNDDEESFGTSDLADPDPQVDLSRLAPDFFDLIFIDECHRSIYGSWKAVLDYFAAAARFVGLTATPEAETLAFFNQNKVIDYSLEQSILDGINVGSDIYRIKTEITQGGGEIEQGESILLQTARTDMVQEDTNEAYRTYSSSELNRSIIKDDQIRTVLTEYRNVVYSQLFPEREPIMDWLPKTLIFALNETHARRIVEIAREVFQREDDRFVQQITYSVGDSDGLIRNFRNDKEFRIAVTVTLVATGTDVKPLEVLLFMRDVESHTLFVQMQGRGVRTIDSGKLLNVTPNAKEGKDGFVIVDAVGVTESAKHHTPPGQTPSAGLTLQQLLERLAHGELSDDYLNRLANKLARIHLKIQQKQREHFAKLTGGATMANLAEGIFNALKKGNLPPYRDSGEPNTERRNLIAALIMNPQAREYLLQCARTVITIAPSGQTDTVLESGFKTNPAAALENTRAFEQYVYEHKDDIEALRILYNHTGESITYELLQDLQENLRAAILFRSPAALWQDYYMVDQNKVKRLKDGQEKTALTNLIQLVRFAFKQLQELRSLPSMAAQRFNLWCGQAQRPLTPAQHQIMKQILGYIAANAPDWNDIADHDQTAAAQLSNAFGGVRQAQDMLYSLSQFLFQHSA